MNKKYGKKSEKRRKQRQRNKDRKIFIKGISYSNSTYVHLHKLNSSNAKNEGKNERKREKSLREKYNDQIDFLGRKGDENEDQKNTYQNNENQLNKDETFIILTQNLHKSRAPSLELSKIAEETKCKIILAQEPPLTNNGSIECLVRDYCVSFGDSPRACIYHNKNMNIVGVPSLSSRDLAVAIWSQLDRKLLICSVYLDGTLDINMQMERLQKITDFSEENEYELLLSGDFNSHSPIWGSVRENARGKAVEEFIVANGLWPLNDGSPTWRNYKSESAIDLTLVSDTLMPRALRWNATFATSSDHATLISEVLMPKTRAPSFKSVKQTNWEKYKEMLGNAGKNWQPSGPWSAGRLDVEALLLQDEIISAWKQATRTRVEREDKKANWWTSECTSARTALHVAARKLKVDNSEASRAIVLLKRKALRETIQKAKDKADTSRVDAMIESKDLAKLTKELEIPCKIPCLKSEGREVPMEEVLGVLLDEHCPGSSDIKEYTPPVHKTTWEHVEKKFKFAGKKEVQIAFKSFEQFKTPGPDGIRPIMLQKLDEKFIERIEVIYKISLELSHIPLPWRVSGLKFLKKGGKRNWSSPRSYRPVALGSFLLKTLEKLMLNKLNSSTLKFNPLHKMQHAFRKGYSCDSALLSALDIIESGTKRDHYVLGVSLDIKGAFDNVKPEYLLKALKEKKAPKWFNSLIYNYLQHRTVAVELNGKIELRQLNTGTQQGSAISPTLWVVAFDGLLELVNTEGFHGVGFADDALILIAGPDPGTLVEKMNRKMKEVEKWASEAGLSFSAEKTCAIFFTPENRRVNAMEVAGKQKKIRVGGKEVHYTDNIKYLGITLDSKLNFKMHVEKKLEKARACFMMLNARLKQAYGQKAKLIRWVYNQVVLPAFTYGCHIWADKYKGNLDCLNRLAAAAIAPHFKNTPTRALEVVLDLPPINLLLQKEKLSKFQAAAKYVSRPWTGRNREGRFTATYNKIETELHDLGIAVEEIDKCHSREEAAYDTSLKEEEEETDVEVFTDGSKSEKGVGYGLAIRKGGIFCREEAGGLPEDTSVFRRR